MSQYYKVILEHVSLKILLQHVLSSPIRFPGAYPPRPTSLPRPHSPFERPRCNLSQGPPVCLQRWLRPSSSPQPAPCGPQAPVEGELFDPPKRTRATLP
ncbi:hypothetical protein Dimus_037985 [Dionaea muscipula]